MLKKLLVGMLVLPVMLLGCAEGESFTDAGKRGLFEGDVKATATLAPSATPGKADTPSPSPEPPAEPSPSPSSLSTPHVSEDARPAEEPSIWELDDVAPSFWLKKRNNGLYDVVANLHWIADGVDEDIEMEPVKVLLELSLDEPGIAIRFIEMPWFNDGLTEEEAWAFLALLYIDSFTPNASTQVSRSPWVMDGVSDFESWAITSLADIFDESPETANSLISKPWFQDGLTEDEAEAVELLGLLSYKNGSASEFISMPFLESVEEADVLALASLYQLALLKWDRLTTSTRFDEFTSHPTVTDGITDEETVFVTLASSAYEVNPGLTDTLLDPSAVISETRTINLPMAGEVELVVVRTQQGSGRSLDLLEESVRFTESYMGEPFPVNLVLLLYADAVQPGFVGHNSGTNIVVHPDFDRDDASSEADEAEFIILHEVAHFYWHSSSYSWLDEGAAEFLTAAYAEHSIGFDMTDISPTDVMDDYDCADGTTLKSLEGMTGPQAEDCAYALGLLFFLDLHQAVGAEEFQRGFRGLYLAGRDVLDPDSPNARNSTHVRKVFEFSVAATENVIPKWLED